MGQFDSNYKSGPTCYLPLSTGAFAYISGDTVAANINSADNVLKKIVMEHFEEIIKSQKKTGDYGVIVEIIEKEVKYLIKNGIKDTAEALEWFLTMFALRKFAEILDDLEHQNQGENR